uniref:Uncharacterized protein n=1 Tax=Amphimedon queenslandica TaxID=400682 RepID=A0A1X7UJ27_AMPQE
MQQTEQRAQNASYENHIALPEDDMDEDYDHTGNSTTTFDAVDDIDDKEEERCGSTMIQEISDEDLIHAIERIDNDEEEHETDSTQAPIAGF